jgi:hypothetical protein
LHDPAEPGWRQAEQVILDYLARHPFAADSEQGIAQWWLASAGVLVTADELQRALGALLQQGRIERVPLPDRGAIYRAPRPPSATH